MFLFLFRLGQYSTLALAHGHFLGDFFTPLPIQLGLGAGLFALWALVLFLVLALAKLGHGGEVVMFCEDRMRCLVGDFERNEWLSAIVTWTIDSKSTNGIQLLLQFSRVRVKSSASFPRDPRRRSRHRGAALPRAKIITIS